MAVLTRVDIDGTDITSSYLVSYKITRTFGDEVGFGEIRITKKIDDVLSLSENMQVEIWRGFTTATDEKVFDGFISAIRSEGGLLTIVIKDKLWQLVRREVTQFYDENISASAGKISEIFKDLVETYGGLTADGTSVQDSGTVNTLPQFICNHANVFERCKALADAIDWQFYYRADTDKVYFEPKGFTDSKTVLTVGDNVIRVPKWTRDEERLVNSITVVGASQEVETTETGQIGTTTGYTTSEVALNFEPLSVKVFSDASNPPTTLQTGSIPESTATYFYYVDRKNKKIIPAVGTSFTSSHYLQTQYSYRRPIPVRVRNQASIDNYGITENTITFNDLTTIEEAELRGRTHIDKYGTPFLSSVLAVNPVSTNDYAAGSRVQVVDDVNTPTVNALLLVNRIELRYPADFDELYVGDKEWRLAEWQNMVEERLKRLFEEQLENQDILVEVVDADNTVNLPSFVPRYRKVLTQSFTAPDVFLLSNPTHGILGTSELGDAGAGPQNNHAVMQYQNIYTENFTDNDFEDTANSTATWSGGSLSFTSGQIGQSLSIDYNNGTITQARLTATISSGTFTLELSADGGSNWETVSNGLLHTFTNTGTDLRWRITENAASTGTITQVIVRGYH